MATDDANAGYCFGIPDEQCTSSRCGAEVCRFGRDAYFSASGTGFDANPGPEAEFCAEAVTNALAGRPMARSWTGDHAAPGRTDAHELGVGRLGELCALLAAGEVFWSLLPVPEMLG
jgi:hypothetical protein